MNKDIENLNNTVFCRLSPSPIHGVGVFAIRDIEEGIQIDIQLGTPIVMSASDFSKILPEIQSLILDRYALTSEPFNFSSPNDNQLLNLFINHSETPNCIQGKTIKAISRGEEIVENYKDAINLALLSKEHLTFI